MENAMKSMISENEMRETLRRHGAFKSAVLEVAAYCCLAAGFIFLPEKR